MKLFNFATAYEMVVFIYSLGRASIAYWLTDCTCVKSGVLHICT